MIVRTVIVDDEPLARQGLREFAELDDEVVIVGECGDCDTAVDLIKTERPDLVLLDIQMPAGSGFDVLAQLEAPFPAVIFVTAYDSYALRAFDAHAIDYLLKPVSRERFDQSLERAKVQLGYARNATLTDRLEALIGDLKSQRDFPERLTVKDRGAVVFVPVKSIEWIESAGNYVKLHVGTKHHLVRKTMTHLGKLLDPERFARIHRSTMVNVERIKEIQPWFKGDHLVILHDGTKLTMSRTYKDRLLP